MTVALANLLAQMQEDRPLTTENALGLAGYHQLGQAYRRAHKRCEGLQRGNFLANMHQLETGQASDPAKRRVHNQQILQSQQDRADLWAQIAPHKQAAQNFLQRHHSKP